MKGKVRNSPFPKKVLRYKKQELQTQKKIKKALIGKKGDHKNRKKKAFSHPSIFTDSREEDERNKVKPKYPNLYVLAQP